MKYHSSIIVDDIETVVNDVIQECRNLRSQVTTAALQALTLMFLHLGRDMETKYLDDIAQLLLTKAGDTNRYDDKTEWSADYRHFEQQLIMSSFFLLIYCMISVILQKLMISP